MSEYTPTTEQVRWQYTREEPPRIGTVSEKTAEFDRWLAQHDAEVRAAEQERIAQAVAPLLNELESTPSTGYYAPWAEATQVAIFKKIRGRGSDNDR